MIIDCHGHYTTEPKDLHRFRKEQTAAAKDKTAMPSRAALKMSDDEIVSTLKEHLADKDRLRSMIAVSSQRVTRDFSTEAFADRVITACRQFLSHLRTSQF